MTPEGRPESWRELWQVSTPVMRWRLAVILGWVVFTGVACLALVAVSVTLVLSLG